MLTWFSWLTQTATHQLRLNRLSSTASYQALIGQIKSPTRPHCGSGDETAEHLLLLCPKWAAERQRYFGDSIDITDVFQDYESLVEFLISSGHLSPHIGSAWRARHDNNNNNSLLELKSGTTYSWQKLKCVFFRLSYQRLETRSPQRHHAHTAITY